MLAAADQITVTVRGKGGHASTPHRAADPIPVACEIVIALQTMVTRKFDVFDPVVITVGSFHAGTTNNVIPDEARLEVTIRSFSRPARALVRDSAVRVVHQIAAAHGLTATAEFTGSYPVTINNDAEARFAAGVVTGFLGEDRHHPQVNPMAGAEDFSYVLEDVPGAFIMLGACPPGVDPATAPFNHSALAVFDDMVLADGAALLTELAVRRLNRETAG
jgi:hippurate hydrolase